MGALVYNPFRKIGKTKVHFITLESHNQELENFTTRHRYLVLYPQESLKSVNSDRNYFLRLSLLITQIAALMFFRRGTSSQIPDELCYSICHLAWHMSANDNFTFVCFCWSTVIVSSVFTALYHNVFVTFASHWPYNPGHPSLVSAWWWPYNPTHPYSVSAWWWPLPNGDHC